LARQGDVYSASFAAVPHVIEALASSPTKADSTYFQFPAWVEICRQKADGKIPSGLARAYFDSLSRPPQLVSAAAGQIWDSAFLCCALAAIAASKGQIVVAEAALELQPDVAKDFMQWLTDSWPLIRKSPNRKKLKILSNPKSGSSSQPIPSGPSTD
jgi:hypothetical protein